jgi:hypothetical protein
MSFYLKRLDCDFPLVGGGGAWPHYARARL